MKSKQTCPITVIVRIKRFYTVHEMAINTHKVIIILCRVLIGI